MIRALPWILILALYGMASEQDFRDQELAAQAQRVTYAHR